MVELNWHSSKAGLLFQRRFIPVVIGVMLVTASLLSSCDGAARIFNASPNTEVDWDLDEIKEKGTLKAIMVYSSTSYFIYRGRTMGYEYELIRHFAESQGLKLEVVVAQDIDELITMLNRGDGDVVAYGMTITQDREELVDFTQHLYLTNQVLVQRKPENWRRMKQADLQKALITDPAQLIGDTVAVRRNTSYYERLINLQQEIGGQIHIETIEGKTSTDLIIERVADGSLKYTVADANIAKVNAGFHQNLDIGTPLSLSQRVGWAVRENSSELKDALNDWIEEIRDKPEHKALYKKYFDHKQSYLARAKSPYLSLNEGKISIYDDLVKKYSAQNRWDWRLVSALIYEESGFNPVDTSWAGAQGLMQLMPATSADLGVEDPTDPESSIRGGTRYLRTLWDLWKDIPDSLNRYQFALASYNCGYAHILDAQRLAAKNGADPLTWVGNVETYLLNLSYSEYYNDEVVRYGFVRGNIPVNYVRNIMSRYAQYRNLLPEHKAPG